MTNINDYKKRFYNLMESTMGDSKPLIKEGPDPTDVNPKITTALQGVATFYNNSLNQYYTKNPNKKPNPVTTFSVKKTTGYKDANGELEAVWKPYFGDTELNVDGLRLNAIYDYQFKAVPTMKNAVNTFIIDPIMRKMVSIDGATRVNTTPSNTAVTAITNILKQVNPTRP
jgi:hypothetical protein